MFNCNFLILFNNPFLNKMIFDIHDFNIILNEKKRKIKIKKIITFPFRKKKTVFFHCAINVFSDKNFFEKKKGIFDCVFDIQLKIKIKKKKQKMFLGKFNHINNLFSLLFLKTVSERNQIKKKSKEILKLVFFSKIFSKNQNKKKKIFNFSRFLKFPSNKIKNLHFHHCFGKISDGLSNFNFNFFLKISKIKIFFKKNEKLIFSIDFIFMYNKKIKNIKKKMMLYFRKISHNSTKLFLVNYWKKNFLRQALVSNFFSIGFIFKKKFFLSNNILFYFSKNFFSVGKSIIDLKVNFLRENQGHYQNFRVGFTVFRIGIFVKEESKKKFSNGRIDNLFFLKNSNNLNEKFEKRLYLIKKNENFWNKKTSFSEFYGNIFVRSFLVEELIGNSADFFGKKWIFCFESILIINNYKKILGWKFFALIIFFRFSFFLFHFLYLVLILKSWGNSLFSFYNFKLNNFEFLEKKNNFLLIHEKEKIFSLLYNKNKRYFFKKKK